jgi:hypothetical protein
MFYKGGGTTAADLKVYADCNKNSESYGWLARLESLDVVNHPHIVGLTQLMVCVGGLFLYCINQTTDNYKN